MNNEQLHRAKELIRGHRESPEISTTVVEDKGNFLIVAQGTEVILMTQKDVFANLEKFKQFAARGGYHVKKS